VKILFLSSGARVPSARFRILPYIKHFKADGHHCVVAHSFPQKYDYFPWMGFRPSQLLKRSVRWWHWLRAKLNRFDVVFIDREIFDDETTQMEERFRECCGKLVIDLDDAVFLRHPAKFDLLLKMADLVVCGNRFLMEKAALLNQQLLHIPTCVDMGDYTMRRPSVDGARPVVGWMGTTGNLKYLEVVAEALRRVASEVDFELRVVVPDVAPLQQTDLEGVNFVHDPWDPANEVDQLKGMDIGLMPLFPNQEWDIYKCGLKLIQYLSVGVPGIAAPVGVNSEIIDGNQNGYVAQETEEWVTALRALLKSPALRKRMGARGRQTVTDKYSIQANYPVMRDALLRLTGSDSDRRISG
jgi:glycosyltransferase involved in cell wall biosynthesis